NASTATQPAFESSPYVTFPSAPGQLTVVYVYSLRIRNTASKVIEGVAWDYVFTDPANQNEVGRREFLSFETIPPGKHTTFRGVLRSAPTKLIRLHDRQKSEIKPRESASIQCVLYADHTVWKHQSARLGVCEMLANRSSLLEKARRS